MNRNRLPRFAVPGAALATLIVPVLVSGCFEIEGPEGCSECIACYEDLVGIDEAYRNPAPTGTEPTNGDDPRDTGMGDEEGEPVAGDLRRPDRPRVPGAVTRPKIDPNLRGGKSYPKPSPKY